MSKIIILKGLPASGKSTKAKELIEMYGNCVRLNKDLIRTMLHFDKFSFKNEDLTQKASRTLAKMYLETGVNVIIDDTNLNPKVVQSWVDLAKETKSKIEHHDIKTSYLECLSRDAQRIDRGERGVGEAVITKMALQYGRYKEVIHPYDKVIICDIDGTVADLTHRLHFVKGKDKPDWNSFFAHMHLDTPKSEVLSQVARYARQEEATVIFVSARPENYRKETEEWITRHFSKSKIIMRPANDTREDQIVKEEIYDKYLKDLNIVAVYDDRPRVIRMWKSKGLHVVDCGTGEEF